MKENSLTLFYTAAADYARMRGIIIADTKFEFGTERRRQPDAGRRSANTRFLALLDVDEYTPGRPQESFDKQFVRDYLETLDWNKEPPGPTLPDEVVEGTRQRYLEAYLRLTGKSLT